MERCGEEEWRVKVGGSEEGEKEDVGGWGREGERERESEQRRATRERMSKIGGLKREFGNMPCRGYQRRMLGCLR